MFALLTDKQSVVRRAVRRTRRALRERAVPYWRRLLGPVQFIAITGSCGKTTATGLLGAILAKAGPTHVGIDNNTEPAIRHTLLRARPWHRWCVQELAANEPGALAARAALLRPQIGIVTMVGSDHLSNYRSLDAIAQEKGSLVELLPKDGIAFLNADDRRVAAMRTRTKARVVTFGCSAGADVCAFEVSSIWPRRLSLKVAFKGEVISLQTRLVGEFWVSSVLAALSCALELGVDPAMAAKAIEQFEPMFGRNSVHVSKDGPVFVCGARKAPHFSMPIDLKLIAQAQAPRKTLVLGNISDYPGSGSPKYRNAARNAIAGGARVIGVGMNARTIRKMVSDHPAGQVSFFETSKEAHDFMVATAVPGELVFLKSASSGHIERIVLNWKRHDGCWLENCGRFHCDLCPYLKGGAPQGGMAGVSNAGSIPSLAVTA